MKTKASVSIAAGALLSLALLAQAPARAQGTASEASAVSMLPVAISVVAPAMLLSAGAALTVVAVEASADGTVWLLERASDGARVSVRFAGRLLGATALSIGTAVTVGTLASGHVLSAAGRAIAFIPNEIGAALLHNEQVSR
jgi:hypothetical protein